MIRREGRMIRWGLVVCLLPLAGCVAVGPVVTSLTTAGVAGTVGSATGSALAGALAGIGVSFGVDLGVDYGERLIQGNVQSAIASAAGPLAAGVAAPWQVAEWLPFTGRSGTVEVAREFGAAIPCKDIIFTVADDREHRVFATTLCRNDQGRWMWAAAEPSVHRWDFLQ